MLVPHTFLYYFGDHTAATDLRPHGVIDLELYTDIQVVDGEFLVFEGRGLMQDVSCQFFFTSK